MPLWLLHFSQKLECDFTNFNCAHLYNTLSNKTPSQISCPVLACLWRFLIRHVFFATNHGCAFNRLQYSAAFVATMEFHFTLSGSQLFFNTFGWEIIGLVLVWYMGNSRIKRQGLGSLSSSSISPLWRWYVFYQLLETFMSCISVSILRRHLMVWAVYAPRFLFSAIFLVLHCLGQVLSYVLVQVYD